MECFDQVKYDRVATALNKLEAGDPNYNPNMKRIKHEILNSIANMIMEVNNDDWKRINLTSQKISKLSIKLEDWEKKTR